MKNTIRKLLNKLTLEQNYIAPVTTDLRDKVILVTGGSRGIGKAIIEVLARNGATVISISRTKLDGGESISLIADVRDKNDCLKAVNTVISTYKRVDVLINNAGEFAQGELESVSLDKLNSVIDTNIKAAFFMSQCILPHMKKQKFGTIINMGSKISHNTNVGSGKVLYALTKYAVEGFSFSLNKELKKYGIRVICLMPGTVATFVSRKTKEFMSPFDISSLVLTLIKHENIDFESIVFKSKMQDI